MSAWTEHVETWQHCTNCPLCEQRDRICLARGTVPADVLFIGEAPGESEDTLGEPFVGPVGRLLNEIIDRALPSWVKYALTNLVACFPAEAKAAGVNKPEQDEIEACKDRLIEFIHIAQPKLIVCVGRLASDNIGETIQDYNACYDDYLVGNELKFADIVHPADILKMPNAQRNMAVQKCIVVLRNAVEDMLQSSPTTKQEPVNASVQSQPGFRPPVEQQYTDYSNCPEDFTIPF